MIFKNNPEEAEKGRAMLKQLWDDLDSDKDGRLIKQEYMAFCKAFVELGDRLNGTTYTNDDEYNLEKWNAALKTIPNLVAWEDFLLETRAKFSWTTAKYESKKC